jgi:hypothetical protein
MTLHKLLLLTSVSAVCLAYLVSPSTTLAGVQFPPSSSGGGTPAGTTGQIQYNNTGVFGGVTAVPVANGGTGATTATAARTNLNASTATLPVNTLFGFGDSYTLGTGATNNVTQSFMALLGRDVSAPMLNYGVGGTTIAQIVSSVFTNFFSSPITPSVSIIQGGENDGTACASPTTALCGTAFKINYNAALAWLSIPETFRIRASNATKTGTWVATTDVYVPTATTSYGTPLTSIVSGSTLTFNVPTSASTKVSITYKVASGNTGTFSVNVDGSLVTDICSATTTFSSAPCNSNPVVSASGTFYRQEYTVTANQTHTVIVTQLGTPLIEIAAVDWIPPSGTTAVNGVFAQSSSPNYTTPAASWNPIIPGIVTNLTSQGLPIYYVDLVTGNPGMNTTTDVAVTATTACPASNSAGHPNDCGYNNIYKTIVNTQLANNYIFSSLGTGGRVIANTGVLNFPFTVQPNANTVALHNNLFSSLGGTGTGPSGIDLYRGGNTTSIVNYQDGSSGLPWSAKFVSGFSLLSNGVFWNCLSQWSGNITTTPVNANYTTKSCFDQNGNLYTQALSTNAGLAVGTSYFSTAAPTNGAIIQGNVGIGTATPQANLHVNGTMKTAGYTVSTLPTGVIGMFAYVTDQTTTCPATGGALTGGGAIVCPVFYNGSAWVGD